MARTAAVALLAATAVALAGCSAGKAKSDQVRPSKPPTSANPSPTPDLTALRNFKSPRNYQPVAAPVRIIVPRIGVDSALQRLGKDPAGMVQVPTRYGVAGWYAQGPRPGQLGAAVILGHVDSKSGPAIFYRLRDLRHGDQVLVRRGDGSTARFRIDRVSQYPKNHFPTDDVYYPTLQPVLRLVTCGGIFDRRAGHYRSNLIAYASLAP